MIRRGGAGMRRLMNVLWAALMMVGLWVVPAPTASACSCAAQPFAELMRSADVVVIGTVTDTLGSDSERRFAVRVDAVHRGNVRERVVVKSFGNEGGCGTSLPEGRRMLLLADREKRDLVTTLCSGNRRATTTARTQATVALGLAEAPRAGDDPAIVRFDRERAEHTRRAWIIGSGTAVLVGVVALLLWRRRATSRA